MSTIPTVTFQDQINAIKADAEYIKADLFYAKYRDVIADDRHPLQRIAQTQWQGATRRDMQAGGQSPDEVVS